MSNTSVSGTVAKLYISHSIGQIIAFDRDAMRISQKSYIAKNNILWIIFLSQTAYPIA